MPEPPVEIVDKRGDVYLDICRTQIEMVAKSILVSSHVLILCSGYFQRCFEGGFGESKKFKDNTKKGRKTRITLNEDNPRVMLILCRAIHHQAQNTPGIKTLKSLWDHCDKYDCVASLKPFYRGWVREHMDALMSPLWWSVPTTLSETKSAIDLLHLLNLAYRFDLAQEFAQLSSYLILHDFQGIRKSENDVVENFEGIVTPHSLVGFTTANDGLAWVDYIQREILKSFDIKLDRLIRNYPQNDQFIKSFLMPKNRPSAHFLSDTFINYSRLLMDTPEGKISRYMQDLAAEARLCLQCVKEEGREVPTDYCGHRRLCLQCHQLRPTRKTCTVCDNKARDRETCIMSWARQSGINIRSVEEYSDPEFESKSESEAEPDLHTGKGRHDESASDTSDSD
jgi:hypothetical protein